jgi:hypothetical protein
MAEEKDREIVYSTLKKEYFIRTDGKPVTVGKIRDKIFSDYNLEMSEKTIKLCLKKLESMDRILCYYDPRDGLFSSVIV